MSLLFDPPGVRDKNRTRTLKNRNGRNARQKTVRPTLPQVRKAKQRSYRKKFKRERPKNITKSTLESFATRLGISVDAVRDFIDILRRSQEEVSYGTAALTVLLLYVESLNIAERQRQLLRPTQLPVVTEYVAACNDTPPEVEEILTPEEIDTWSDVVLKAVGELIWYSICR